MNNYEIKDEVTMVLTNSDTGEVLCEWTIDAHSKLNPLEMVSFMQESLQSVLKNK